MRSSDEKQSPRRLGGLALTENRGKFLRFDNSQQPSQQHSQAQACPVNSRGAVGATRTRDRVVSGDPGRGARLPDHRAVVTFGVLWVKAHNGLEEATGRNHEEASATRRAPAR